MINCLHKIKKKHCKKKGYLFVFVVALLSLLFVFGNEVVAGDLGLVGNGDFEVGNLGQFGSEAIDDWPTWGNSGYHHADYNHTIGGAKAVMLWWDDTGMFQKITGLSASTDYYFNAYM